MASSAAGEKGSAASAASTAEEKPVRQQPCGEPELTLDGAFSADGVDLTVIRWMLSPTPTERLQAAQQLIDAASALRGGEA